MGAQTYSDRILLPFSPRYNPPDTVGPVLANTVLSV
jgi:hypothetical protein